MISESLSYFASRLLGFYMEAIDSDDYSSVGTSHRGGNADRDSRNKVGERDSKSKCVCVLF